MNDLFSVIQKEFEVLFEPILSFEKKFTIEKLMMDKNDKYHYLFSLPSRLKNLLLKVDL